MKEKNKKLQFFRYFIADYLAATIAWALFYCFRKQYINQLIHGSLHEFTLDNSFYSGIIIVPLFWVLLHYTSGAYRNLFRKSRLQELGKTLFVVTLGVIFIFFALILDDEILDYTNYYESFAFLWTLQFGLTYLPRVIISSQTAHKVQKRKIGFNTLMIGSNDNALAVYHEFLHKPKSAGNNFVGFITINGDPTDPLSDHIPHLGKLNNLIDIITSENIEEVIIAIEPSERERIKQILIKAKACNVTIKAIPDLMDIIAGKASMASIFDVPLVELSHEVMPVWQQSFKRLMDVVCSVLALLVLSPFLLLVILLVKRSSKGPIFYSHERVGKNGVPFSIYKFRSMYVGAEKNGPALSCKDDPRITPFGKFMRIHRIDELPQFYNVLKGDMSLVGPRPERQFFIDQIVQKAPEYYLTLKVRPGITSWGQVKYGYAENVDEMVDRLKYDLIYFENMSLYVDLKILIYTIRTVVNGQGK